VFNILLQVLDDGRLTDGHGRTVDFRNTVIVMTSNLGSDIIQNLTGTGDYARMKSAVMQVVSGHFRPEFINRIDEVVVFHALERSQIRAIAEVQIAGLRARLAQQDIGLEITPAALDQLGEVGFDPVYGARPLKRAIQNLLETPLAEALLKGQYRPGDTVMVEAGDGALRLGGARADAA
jgi:ATP-dependent Clp protease ATP-binding subunit ClpB